MKTDDKRQQLILEAFAQPEGDCATEMISQALQRWTQLAARLSPLIGDAGLSALYGRSLHLCIAEYGWLAPAEAGCPIGSLLGRLREDLDKAGEMHAPEANLALINTFAGLLAKLIGDPLTDRLLSDAWRTESKGTNTQEMGK